MSSVGCSDWLAFCALLSLNPRSTVIPKIKINLWDSNGLMTNANLIGGHQAGQFYPINEAQTECANFLSGSSGAGCKATGGDEDAFIRTLEVERANKPMDRFLRNRTVLGVPFCLNIDLVEAKPV